MFPSSLMLHWHLLVKMQKLSKDQSTQIKCKKKRKNRSYLLVVQWFTFVLTRTFVKPSVAFLLHSIYTKTTTKEVIQNWDQVDIYSVEIKCSLLDSLLNSHSVQMTSNINCISSDSLFEKFFLHFWRVKHPMSLYRSTDWAPLPLYYLAL